MGLNMIFYEKPKAWDISMEDIEEENYQCELDGKDSKYFLEAYEEIQHIGVHNYIAELLAEKENISLGEAFVYMENNYVELFEEDLKNIMKKAKEDSFKNLKGRYEDVYDEEDDLLIIKIMGYLLLGVKNNYIYYTAN